MFADHTRASDADNARTCAIKLHSAKTDHHPCEQMLRDQGCANGPPATETC
jgi:hypothetical protein